MTTAIFSTAPASSPLRQYLLDVTYAARAFAEALFSAQDRRAAEDSDARAKAQGRRQLFSLAKQYDSHSPSLSAELRAIAARD